MMSQECAFKCTKFECALKTKIYYEKRRKSRNFNQRNNFESNN